MKKPGMFLPVTAGAIALTGFPKGTDVTYYTVETPKMSGSVRLAVLADLHGRSLSAEEIRRIRDTSPDLIVIPGDLFDFHDRRDDRVLPMIDTLQDIPQFYVTGNHELERGDAEDLYALLESHGVTVLNDRAETLVFRDAVIELGGYACRWTEKDCSPKAVNQMFHTGHYRILLSHRPHWISLYNAVNCDLVISGHAHGGQWRIPGTEQGICSPQQGILPEYTSGIHHLHHSDLIISRGLVKTYHGIPRLFNQPEIVIVDLLPGSPLT